MFLCQKNNLMENLFSLIKILHIIMGSIALAAGPVAMYNQNGGKLHRISGKLYFYSMFSIFVSSVYMSIVKENWFLFMIALFTLYLISTGYRALYLKQLHKGQKPAKIDWLILWLGSIAGIGLLIWGTFVIISGNSFGIVAIAFGFFLLQGTRSDYKRFTVPPSEKNHWLFTHISGMIGGYIATFTAFLVQNLHTDPAFIAWLLPTAVFTPVIVVTIRKFKIKKGSSEKLIISK